MDKKGEIISILIRDYGESISINELTRRLDEMYGSAHYPNVHGKVEEMKADGTVSLERAGKSLLVRLDQSNPMLADTLAEHDLAEKRRFLAENPDARTLFFRLGQGMKDLVSSLSAVKPRESLKMNRLELLAILGEGDDPDTGAREEKAYRVAKEAGEMGNIRVDLLAVPKEEFSRHLSAGDANPIKSMARERVAVLDPQSYWMDFLDTARVARVRLENEVKPTNICEGDMLFNLRRLGYDEFGAGKADGKQICAELVAASLLLQEDARRIGAVPIILAKNTFSPRLMAFLAEKHGAGGRLLWLLGTAIGSRKTPEISETARILRKHGIREEPVAGIRDIKDKMGLYHATG